MTNPYRFIASLALISLIMGAMPTSLSAAQQTGTITIEQQSPNGIFGEWILIKPGNKKLSLKRESYTIQDALVGNYTLLVEPPSGSDTIVRVFIDQDLLESYEQPQASFTLEQNVHMRLRVEYNFTRVGVIGANSQPPGIGYTINGPNDLELKGETPKSYTEMPEGQYTITYDKIPDCPEARPISDKLIPDGRINFTITFDCKGLENIELQQNYERSLQFVTAEINGQQITFTDVPMDQWFATYVNKTIRTGIVTGYRDDAGNLTGKYGPGDNVTIAQLAKIAHELADIDETRTTHLPPKNIRARNAWFEQYFASAEKLDWLVYRDHRIDPGRPATRGEVVATLLQALDVRRFWSQGNMFTDVQRSTDYSSSIETAATDGIVSGFTDASGNSTGEFGPERPVNRAEMAKLIATAIETYIENADY